MQKEQLTGIIGKELNIHLEKNGLLAGERKGCTKRSRGMKDQLLVEKTVLENCQRRLNNLSMARIDYRKAYDMVPHPWILKCLNLFGTARNIMTLIGMSTANWNIGWNKPSTSWHQERDLAKKDESRRQTPQEHDTNQSPSVHGGSKVVWYEQRKTWLPCADSENILRGHPVVILGLHKCAVLEMQRGKQEESKLTARE